MFKTKELPRGIKRVVIDGDMILYRAAWATESGTPQDCRDKLDELMIDLINSTVIFGTPDNVVVYLTGEGNFRNDIAVTLPYKGNRKESRKPQHKQVAHDHIVNFWGAIVVDGMEADDACAVEVDLAEGQYDVVLASRDKDFLQIPTWHYETLKKEFTKVTEWEGNVFLYTQILTGDAVDNIKGLKGIGPAKAGKLLVECENVNQLFKVCVDTYMKMEELSEGEATERVTENAQLLYLLREVGVMWKAP